MSLRLQDVLESADQLDDTVINKYLYGLEMEESEISTLFNYVLQYALYQMEMDVYIPSIRIKQAKESINWINVIVQDLERQGLYCIEEQ